MVPPPHPGVPTPQAARNLASAQVAAATLAATCLVLAVRWSLSPAVNPGPSALWYLWVYLPTVVLGAGLAVAARWGRWPGVPLAVAVLLLACGTSLTWVDLHFGDDTLAFAIAVFGLGVVYSAGPLVYGLLLGGAFGVLAVSTWLTVPGRLVGADFGTTLIVVALAYIGAQQLERQRRQSDQLAERLEAANRELRETSLRDGLTGLYNRRFLDEFLAGNRALSIRMDRPLTAVLLDIDHFKDINDRFGHGVGDGALRTLGRILLRELRESDLAARYGGDEFVLIFPHTGAADADRALRRILERVRASSWEGIEGPVTFSAGIAELSGQESATELLDRADRQLYVAKRTRNGIAGGT